MASQQHPSQMTRQSGYGMQAQDLATICSRGICTWSKPQSFLDSQIKATALDNNMVQLWDAYTIIRLRSTQARLALQLFCQMASCQHLPFEIIQSDSEIQIQNLAISCLRSIQTRSQLQYICRIARQQNLSQMIIKSNFRIQVRNFIVAHLKSI